MSCLMQLLVVLIFCEIYYQFLSENCFHTKLFSLYYSLKTFLEKC